MFIADLFEDFAGYIAEGQPRIVVLYPGRFQPFHLGHKDVFQSLQNQYGRDNVWIGTSNKVKLPKSPFNFSDKVQFMHAAGIPSDRIIQVTNPYGPNDYKNALNLDLASTIMIFVIGAPDLQNLDVDSNYTELTPTGRKSKIPPGKVVGDERPLKTFTSLKDCTTADQHQYVLVAKEREKNIQVNGKMIDVSHGTSSRAAWNAVRNNPKQRAEYLLQMYGRNDPEIGLLLDKIPQNINEDEESEYTPLQKSVGQLAYKLEKHDKYQSGKYPAGQDNVIDVKKPWDTKTVDMPGDFRTNTIKTDIGDKIAADPYKPKEMGNPNDWVDNEPGTKMRIKDRFYEEAAGVGVVKNSKDPRYSMATMGDQNDVDEKTLAKMMKGYHLAERTTKLKEEIADLKEKWTAKYKRGINCSHPKGFSQRAHCQGRKK